MPELPEVEVTRRGIAPALIGRRLASADFYAPTLRYPLPHTARNEFVGQTLINITRRAKYLLLDFGVGHLLIHLGMSGSLRLLPNDTSDTSNTSDTLSTPPQKHDHVDLVFENTTLRLRDPRRFGAVLWLTGDVYKHPLLAKLGIEPLDPAFDALWLKNHLKGVKTAIKPALMDGHRIVGIGNIYASESLFRARINPRTPAGKISFARLQRLVPIIKETLLAAIAAGGSSLRDFIHSDGSSGYFQQQYFAYGRTGEPCRICGQLIREIKQAQRTTFYCATCQAR
ncbi:MAG: bifunctional DNA-formamidopyrimidine glycosylase/DNA-(apurinic or apyrimidinic site) lyase [Rugosibacter sp.]